MWREAVVSSLRICLTYPSGGGRLVVTEKIAMLHS